jgi:hypothetical protein
MAIRKKIQCYSDLIGKLDSLDLQICKIKGQLKELKNMLKGEKSISPSLEGIAESPASSAAQNKPKGDA